MTIAQIAISEIYKGLQHWIPVITKCCFYSFLGINIARYDFSESQCGKSYCDAKIAHMRGRIRQYVANGNNVRNATEMKAAIDSFGGVFRIYLICHLREYDTHVLKFQQILWFVKKRKICKQNVTKTKMTITACSKKKQTLRLKK